MNPDHTPFTFVNAIPPGATIIPVDASSLKKSRCQQEYAFSIVRGLRLAEINEYQAFGKAVHRYAELMTLNPNDMPRARKGAYEEWNKFSSDNSKVIPATVAMPETIMPPPLRWGTHVGVETFFEVPWLAFSHAGTTYCIVLMGTMDNLSFNGSIAIVTDIKTSRKWKKEEIFDQYANDSQLYFYMWVLHKFGSALTVIDRDTGLRYKLPPEICAAARDHRIIAQICVCQLKTSPVWVMAAQQGLSPRVAALFEEELLHHIYTDIVPAWLAPQDASRNGWIAGVCSQCNFNRICHIEDEALFKTVRDSQYTTKPYNPAGHV